MEELKEEFDKLNAELASESCEDRDIKEQKMRTNLKKRCKNQNFTIEEPIDSMDLEELRKLNGKLIAYQGQQNRNTINEEARSNQIKQNKYSKDNPYPNN
ncbi:MAG: hypothetical protein UHM19_00710 [Bacteroidales bacterium]|jgi:hypothetical protein|nr:hypothetical protein [Bacteroidales bacterium]